MKWKPFYYPYKHLLHILWKKLHLKKNVQDNDKFTFALEASLMSDWSVIFKGNQIENKIKLDLKTISQLIWYVGLTAV